MNNAELLYDIINDFIGENKITVIELLGVFEVIKAEQFELTDDETEE